MTESTLISAREVARRLDRSVRTVQRQAEVGELPTALKMPGQTGAYLFDRDEIDELASVAP